MKEIQVKFSNTQLELIKNTYAKDCTPTEFNLFIAVCNRLVLDPLKKQIYATVYNKADPRKRQLMIVTSIDGLRSIASRTADYRPDDEEPVYRCMDSLKSPLNPAGIESCSVKAWKQDNTGAWHKVNGTAYWEEFAPQKEIWENGNPSGKFKLEGKWQTMPRLMIAKVAEAQALRKGWPDSSGLYAPEELHRADQEESASEMLAKYEEEQRLRKVNAKDSIMIQWEAGSDLVPVKIGQFGDDVIEIVNRFTRSAELNAFTSINAQPLNEYWARDKAGALEVKKVIERKNEELIRKESAQ